MAVKISLDTATKSLACMSHQHAYTLELVAIICLARTLIMSIDRYNRMRTIVLQLRISNWGSKVYTHAAVLPRSRGNVKKNAESGRNDGLVSGGESGSVRCLFCIPLHSSFLAFGKLHAVGISRPMFLYLY